jgi:regulatory protein
VPIVTRIAPDPRQPGYRMVEVDRGRFASIPAEALDALPIALAVGVALDGPALARLQALADIEAAYRAGLRALEARDQARGALRRRLIQKQHPPAAVDIALARLEARGLVDDRRFAAEYAARRTGAGRGARRVVTDLLARGVDRGIAQTVVAEAMAQEGIDGQQMARAVAQRRAVQLRDLPPKVRKRRLLGYLARRGYPASEVKELVEELCVVRE